MIEVPNANPAAARGGGGPRRAAGDGHARHGRLPRHRRAAAEGPRGRLLPRRLRGPRHLRPGRAEDARRGPEPGDRARPLRAAHLGRQVRGDRRRARRRRGRWRLLARPVEPGRRDVVLRHQRPVDPALEGSYSLPRVPPVDSPEEAERFRCTTHNYAILPMRDPDRYVAVSPYYSGGLSVVDFSDPAAPRGARPLPAAGRGRATRTCGLATGTTVGSTPTSTPRSSGSAPSRWTASGRSRSATSDRRSTRRPRSCPDPRNGPSRVVARERNFGRSALFD